MEISPIGIRRRDTGAYEYRPALWIMPHDGLWIAASKMAKNR